MNELVFQNEEKSLGVNLPNNIYSQILSLCEAFYPLETGGVIIGHYSSDLKWATVTRIIGPQRHSKHNRSSFFRSNYGIKSVLEEEWTLGNYYLGEWHYHPNFSPSPSLTDIRQMRAFSQNSKLNCPQPVLLIIGGEKDNWSINVNVICKNIIQLGISPN